MGKEKRVNIRLQHEGYSLLSISEHFLLIFQSDWLKITQAEKISKSYISYFSDQFLCPFLVVLLLSWQLFL